MDRPNGPRPEEWLRFVQVDPFPRLWSRLGLGDDELRALEIQILSAPERSVVVPGGKGLRKLRFAVPESGRGKSGSYRVFFATFPDRGIVLLMAVLAKGDKADLTKGDIKALAAILAQLGTLFDEGMIR